MLFVAGQGDITALLRDAHDGRDGAVDELMDRVYADLERIALKHLTCRTAEIWNKTGFRSRPLTSFLSPERPCR